LHKLLGKNNKVQTFMDARKEKFGYGATKVVKVNQYKHCHERYRMGLAFAMSNTCIGVRFFPVISMKKKKNLIIMKKLFTLSCALLLTLTGMAKVYKVANADEFKKAADVATPGDEIVIANGNLQRLGANHKCKRYSHAKPVINPCGNSR
jgi:hypothetical protein